MFATSLLPLWGRVQLCIKGKKRQAAFSGFRISTCGYVSGCFTPGLFITWKNGEINQAQVLLFTGWTVLALCAFQQMLNQPTACHKYSRSMLLEGKLIWSVTSLTFSGKYISILWLITYQSRPRLINKDTKITTKQYCSACKFRGLLSMFLLPFQDPTQIMNIYCLFLLFFLCCFMSSFLLCLCSGRRCQW